MNIKYLEEKFIQLHKDLYGNQDINFYVPTDEHSSGFNKIEIEDMDCGMYSITKEDCYCIDNFSKFEAIINKYPKITLDREYAFYDKFESWEDIESAFKGEKEIDLGRI